MGWEGWIYLRSLVLKEHRQSDANKDPIRTQNAKKVLIKDQVLKIRTLLETVPSLIDISSKQKNIKRRDHEHNY